MTTTELPESFSALLLPFNIADIIFNLIRYVCNHILEWVVIANNYIITNALDWSTPMPYAIAAVITCIAIKGNDFARGLAHGIIQITMLVIICTMFSDARNIKAPTIFTDIVNNKLYLIYVYTSVIIYLGFLSDKLRKTIGAPTVPIKNAKLFIYRSATSMLIVTMVALIMVYCSEAISPEIKNYTFIALCLQESWRLS